MAPHPRTLELILADYRRRSADRLAEEAWWRAADQPWPDACRRAACSLWADGTIHGHQRRPGAATCSGFADVLVGVADEVGEAGTFDALLLRIEAAGETFRGAGELLCYDVADRIGLRLGLSPEAIYLHAGTRIGAARLVEGIRRSTRSIRLTDLPGAFAGVTPREAEDILCVYADHFFDMPEAFEIWAAGHGGGCGGARSTARC